MLRLYGREFREKSKRRFNRNATLKEFQLKRVACSDEHCLCGERSSRGEKRAWNRNS